jgi:iron complex outermembrane receptor protein
MTYSRKRLLRFGALLQTASFFAIGNALTAQAQMPPTMEPPEQVLVTGSLIHGAATVGVPVTGLTDQDFKETGSLTVADVLKELPAVTVQVSNAINESGGQAIHNQDVVIHSLSGNASESLLMIDGIRFPPQGLGFCVVDPSIIPTLALERVDVLADGASATYGSDAIAGVVNAVLRRGFDGAITQFQYGQSTDIGGVSLDGQALYGRKWDSGDVTASYEYYHINAVHGPGRSYFTTNFAPFGYDNKDPIGVSMPGIVSTGSLKNGTLPGFSAKAGNLDCTNCFSIPGGTGWNYGSQAPGPTVSWATLLANPGILNEQNPAQYADILPSQERNAATLVVDQNLIDGISFFAEGFYSERRSFELYTPGASPANQQNLTAIVVPTTNPYYPSGAPSNVRVSYDLAVDMNGAKDSSGETSGRYAFGFNAILPYNWFGKVYYSKSVDNSYVTVPNAVNVSEVTAALGGTVSATVFNGIPIGSFTKPANIPYLNLFCDASKFQCNSPATLAYISAVRNYVVRWSIGEFGANFDGPLFSLPGGDVKAAVGANHYSNNNLYSQNFTLSPTAPNSQVPAIVTDPEPYNDWAVYGQLDVPLVGDANKLPLVEALSLELAYRYDSYNLFGNIAVPKVAGAWTVADGFTVRANWGKGYRAPISPEFSAVNGALIQPLNGAAGGADGDLNFSCAAVGKLPGGVANPGTLQAYLNPTCSTSNTALLNPGGITISGGSGVAAPVRIGTGISPEKSDSWNLGFNFTPTDPYLKGFSADVVWYNVRIKGVIGTNGNGLATGDAGTNDPLGKVCTVQANGCQWYARANPNLPITDPSNSAFLAMVTALEASPRSTVSPSTLTSIQFIQDNASINEGFKAVGGIDFNTRYDFDLGDLGAWNAGVSGNYQLLASQQTLGGAPIVSNFIGQNSGGRLHYRARLGWTDTGGPAEGLSITGFLNFIPHSPAPNALISGGGSVPPACFWQTGAPPCYPGAPTYGPFANYPGGTPGLYTWDMSFGYTTGTRPANEYLRNISFQFTVLDLLNKAPPFQYNFSSNRAVAAQIANGFGISPLQRFINIAITKSW